MCLLWFFFASDTKDTTLKTQASTTRIRSLHTSVHQWVLHRLSSHVLEKSDRTNFAACSSQKKNSEFVENVNNFMFCRHFETVHFLCSLDTVTNYLSHRVDIELFLVISRITNSNVTDDEWFSSYSYLEEVFNWYCDFCKTWFRVWPMLNKDSNHSHSWYRITVNEGQSVSKLYRHTTCDLSYTYSFWRKQLLDKKITYGSRISIENSVCI